MRILYVGPDFRGSYMTSWRDALEQLGHEVTTVNSEFYTPFPTRLDRKIVARIVLHPGRQKMDLLNKAVQSAFRSFEPDVTFFGPGRYVYPETVEECGKRGLTVLHTNDDMFNRINQPPYFRDVVRAAGCILTIKSFNVAEFYGIGARRVEFLPSAYDPADHFPQKFASGDESRLGCDIGFIGAFRPERADYLQKTIKANREYTTKVWGGGWEKMRRVHYRIPAFRWPLLSPSVNSFELSCEDYRKVLSGSRISLGLLNHRNRDLHTGRTFEIPACAGFMLAERTSEHCRLFEEDKEAVYFGGFDEMADKIRFYLVNDAARRRIAEAGYRRCIESGYRFLDRAKSLMNIVSEIEGTRSALPSRGR